MCKQPFEHRFSGRISVAERLGLASLGVGVLMSLYLGTATRSAAAPEGLRTLETAVDAWVPLWPPAVMVYGLLYFQIFVPLTLLEDRRVMLRGGLAYTALILIGLPFWLLTPVHVPREPLAATDLFTYGLNVIRSLDPPTNCFPSMHVAEAYLAALVVRRLDRGLGAALLVLATAIWWSTLALGQHWFVDGLAGLGMALAVDRLVFGWRPLPAEALVSGGRGRVLWALGVYLVLFFGLTGPWWVGA